MASEGHTLCNHSWQHNTELGTYDRESIRQDLQRTNNAINGLLPWLTARFMLIPLPSAPVT
jgi:peptidoglycan-N-acetylglucosamine deacetylase